MQIKEYIRSFIKYDNKTLKDMEDQEKTWADTKSFIEPELAKLICLLIRTCNAARVLELGTCIGYSGIWIAESLKEISGKLTTIDYDPRLIREAKLNFEKADLNENIELIEGDIRQLLPNFEDNSFDIVIQDAKKDLYPTLLEDCIRVVKKGGLIIADDTLYKPKGITDKLSKHMHYYNQLVFRDKRLYSSIIDVGDGVTISLKL